MKRRMLWGLIGMIGVGIMAGAQGATKENLQVAYQGESKAKARYEAFAAKADAEGYKSVAVLFRATAKSEAVHAAKHAAMLKKMGVKAVAAVDKPDVKSTKENLETSQKDESLEKSRNWPDRPCPSVARWPPREHMPRCSGKRWRNWMLGKLPARNLAYALSVVMS